MRRCIPVATDGGEHVEPSWSVASAPEPLRGAGGQGCHCWNRVEAVRTLGVSRSTLWRRVRAAGLE
jgi:hypothetical protein